MELIYPMVLTIRSRFTGSTAWLNFTGGADDSIYDIIATLSAISSSVILGGFGEIKRIAVVIHETLRLG